MGAVAFFNKGWEKFLPASGNSEEQPEPACGLSEARRPGPRLLHLAPAPPGRNRSLHASSSARSAARRSARSSRLDSSLLTCYYARDASPRRPVSPPVCASHRSWATAPRSHPLAPSSTQGSLRVQTRCQPCCPGQGSRTRAAGVRGTPEGSRDSGGDRQEEPAEARSSGPAAETPAGSPLRLLPRDPPRPPGPQPDLQPVARGGREHGEDEESQRPQARTGAHGAVGVRPGQRPQVSRRGGRWAPRGRAGAPGRGARRGSASEQPAAPPAAAPAARRTRLSAPPQSRDAAVAAEAGGRAAGRAGGGPRMGLPGRVQRRGTPPPTGAVLSPRDWASPGGPPGPGARTRSEPQPAAGTLGRTPPSWAELEARRPSCWVPARGLRDGRAQLPQPAAAGTAAPPWPRPAAPRRRLGAGIPGRPRRSHRSESGCHSREPSH